MSGAVGDGLRAGDGSGGWVFDASVARSFDDHVSRSIPCYREVQKLAARLAVYFMHGGAVVDWGCATGATLRAIRLEAPSRAASELLGIDTSAEMIAEARARPELVGAKLEVGDVLGYALPRRVDVVLALWTIQFMQPAERVAAIERAANALGVGGAFLLVEKVVPSPAELAAPFQDALWDAKRDAGYSDAEIEAKARSLRGVLRTLDEDTYERWLGAAGFRATRFWQYASFVGWLCLKT